jgi:hypothetical protein
MATKGKLQRQRFLTATISLQASPLVMGPQPIRQYHSLIYGQQSQGILVYNSNYMHKSQNLFYLTTALHVSGVTITHLQEHKTTVTTASGNRYTLLLSAAIVEELEPV